MVDGAPPSAWRVARAILPMPFVATVIVPGLIVAVADERGDGRWLRAAAMVAGAA